eukprot:14839560-Alexandrium_andersonii.AAC.1
MNPFMPVVLHGQAKNPGPDYKEEAREIKITQINVTAFFRNVEALKRLNSDVIAMQELAVAEASQHAAKATAA